MCKFVQKRLLFFATSIAKSTVNGAGFAREAENPWVQGGGMIFVG